MPGNSKEQSGSSAPAIRRPALWVLTLLAFGLVIGRSGALPGLPWVFGGAMALALAAVWLRGCACKGAMAIALALLGAGWWTLRLERPGELARLIEAVAPTALTVEGTVVGSPEIGPSSKGLFARFLPDRPVTRLRMDAHALVDRSTDGAGVTRTPVERAEVMVTVSGEVVGVRAGECVRVTGIARAIEGPLNPGESDFRLWARQEGVAGRLFVSNGELIERVDGARTFGGQLRARWLRAKASARERSTRLLGDALTPAPADAPERARQGRALLAAMLLGERGDSLRDVESAFTRLGLAHIVAISGVNLTILAWAALALVRLTGDRGRLEPLLVALAILIYLVVVPAQTPIVRAGAMALAFLVTEALGRRYDRLNTLAWIGVGVLAWRPLELWSPGFQLSFGVVAALLTLVRPAVTRWFGPAPDPDHAPAAKRILRWGVEACVAAVVAWAVATPAIMAHFAIVTPMAPLATIVLGIPTFLVLLGGYCAMIIAAIFPSAGALAAPLLEWLAGACAAFTTSLDRAPGMTIHAPLVGPVWAAAATAVIVWWLRVGWGGPAAFWRADPDEAAITGRRRPRAAFVLALTTVLTALALADFDRGVVRGAELRVDTLAVGDGACHLLRAPTTSAALADVETVMWDCGSSRLSFAERSLPAMARAMRVGRGVVRTAVITHPNLDHYCGVVDAADTMGLRVVYVGESFIEAAEAKPDGAPAFALRSLRERGVDVRVATAGLTLELGWCTLEFLSPPAGTQWVDTNDSSLVARVTTPSGRRVLLTGDIGKPAMTGLVQRGVELSADALEVPHHGSATSFNFEFVQRVDPPVVLQSTGPSRVNDPRWRLVRPGRRWFATAVDGAITTEVKAEGSPVVRTFMGP